MTKDEVKRGTLIAHTPESLMVAGKLTTGTNGASPVCGYTNSADAEVSYGESI